MVLNVCLRVLQNDPTPRMHLSYVLGAGSKAASIRKRDSVASWLHGVAFRAANNLRKEIMRRHATRNAHGDGA